MLGARKHTTNSMLMSEDGQEAILLKGAIHQEYEGNAGAVIAQSCRLRLKERLTNTLGVEQLTCYEYNREGLESERREYKGSTASSEGVLTRTKYLYEAADNYPPRDHLLALARGNALNPVGTIEVMRIAPDNGGQTLLRQLVSLWSYTRHLMDAESVVRPLQTRRLKNMNSDYQDVVFNDLWSDIDPTAVLEVTTNGGTLVSSNVYRHDKGVPGATVTNAGFRQCAVYTGDYDLGDEVFIERENGWVRHEAFLTGAPRHFGEKATVVLATLKGPARVVEVKPGVDYLVTFWAKTTSSTSVGVDYAPCNLASGVPVGRWPLSELDMSLGTQKSVRKTIAPGDGWTQVQFKIRKSDLAGGSHLLVGLAGSTADYVVDDIRVYPKGAFVKTTYYDHRNRPICSVDGSNTAVFTEYDIWDRVCRVRNARGEALSETSYHLVGEN